MKIQFIRVIEVFAVVLAAATVCIAQQGPYQTSDPYFGIVEVAIDSNGFTGHGDSALLVVDVYDAAACMMVYYGQRYTTDATTGVIPKDSALIRYKKQLKRAVPSGLYTIAFDRPRSPQCYNWIRCSQVPLIPGSVVTMRVYVRNTALKIDNFPKSDYIETKLNSLRVVPGYANDQTKDQTTSTLVLRVRDSLQVPYPFGAVLELVRGWGARFKTDVYMLDDTVTTLTLDTGEVEMTIDSRFRRDAGLESRSGPMRELPQLINLRSGDTVILDVTLGGAHTIDSSALFGGSQRVQHFHGSTSVRHEEVAGMSSRDSGVLALEVVEAATQRPIPKAYASVYQWQWHYQRHWIVDNGASSFAARTGLYNVSCDPTGPDRCWEVSRHDVLVLPGQRTIVRFEMNMKQSSP